MKRFYLTTVIICIAMLLAFSFIFDFWDNRQSFDVIKIGFLSENDEMTSNTYNFIQSGSTLKKEYQDKVEILTSTNVQEDETEEALRDLIRSGCSIIFTNTRSDEVRKVAADYPQVQFCQITVGVNAALEQGGNYHTFNAKSFEGHYVTGIAAGMKLREMIDSGMITADEALIGYVASFPTPDVISGFTAFILGVRSEAPEAHMRVQYVNALSNFSREKSIAKNLIEEGCVIIAQNSGTNGPASACQEKSSERIIFHTGYNESMIDDSSTVSLISSRSNWDPYVLNAVKAVILGKPIETLVPGEIHGNDICAGFDRDWVEMIDLNENNVAAGTEERIQQVINDLKKGKVEIFRGNYLGVDANNVRLKIDLNEGFKENSTSSRPTFHYILRNVITVEKTVED